MAVHDDLLVQARYLITHERGKPKQASLRRAVSAAYYALFHLLTADASERFVTGSGRDKIRMMVRRSFAHATMKAVCQDMVKANLPAKYAAIFPGTLPTQLTNVAQAFINLQQARHEADYDFSTIMNRVDASYLIAQAENAFADWKSIRKTVAADAFLVAMLTQGKRSPQD